MLAWVMNLGFAASEGATQAPAPAGNAPFAMGLGDELWMSTILLAALVRVLSFWRT